MSDHLSAYQRNLILAQIPRNELENLAGCLALVELTNGQILYSEGELVTQVFFPIDSLVSIQFGIREYRGIEIALEGKESVVGIVSTLARSYAGSSAVVRHSGTAYRLSAANLATTVSTSDAFWRISAKYIGTLFNQITQLAFCNRFHTIDSRFSRWLLMSRDRVCADQLSATQESVAQLLGVRRSSISEVAHELRALSIIDYHRGTISIVDRPALEARACGCYSSLRVSFEESPHAKR